MVTCDDLINPNTTPPPLHPQFIDQLRDFPMLMRHLLSEFFSLNGLVLMFRIRFIGCCIMALIYIISPFDIIPEAAFGSYRARGSIFCVRLTPTIILCIKAHEKSGFVHNQLYHNLYLYIFYLFIYYKSDVFY